MSIDHRIGPAPRGRKSRGARGTCAFWFLFGGVVGAFAVAVAWMRHDQAPVPAAEVAEQARPRPPKPTFDFYKMLPQEEVMVPVDTPVKPTPIPAPKAESGASPVPQQAPQQARVAPPETVARPGTYVIQVASFGRASDAERLKAKLALLGIQTSVQAVTVENGKTYHRVRTAAVDQATANALSAQLKRSGHESMMMKVK